MPAIRTAAAAHAVLADARERTHLLLEPVSEADLQRQHDPLMGPIIWDLGHIAAFEELWLTRNLAGPVRFGEMPGLFNPFENPRRVRGELRLPTLAETHAGLEAVRCRVLAVLEGVDFTGDNPLLRDGYVVAMVAQHEDQHQETMLQTLQLKQGEPYAAPRRAGAAGGAVRASLPAPGSMVRWPGGLVEIGTDDRTVSYDNERPRHAVNLAAFDIDAMPVTNGQYLEFMADGGYRRRELWSEAGWSWLAAEGVEAPKHWQRRGSDWWTRSMDRVGPIEAEHPVCHVCAHEADAFARWAGKRLPTEAEWEAAATWDAQSGRKRLNPWGDEEADASRANVDQLAFGTMPVGTYGANVSPGGCYGMIGDVWEWTASDFAPYPGFEAFPYPEYSQVFFGSDYRVLRGGSWATRARVARATFRNWDYPNRRQIFAGFRCAREV